MSKFIQFLNKKPYIISFFQLFWHRSMLHYPPDHLSRNEKAK